MRATLHSLQNIMHFIKYHGLGNDFIILVADLPPFDTRPALSPAMTVALCDRGTGVGADGLVAIRSSTVAALKMELLNSDGSAPEMCGNGLRCVVKHAVDALGLHANPLTVETGAGVLACEWEAAVSGEVMQVQVHMGPVRFAHPSLPAAAEDTAAVVSITCGAAILDAHGVSTGNPHMVIFHDEPEVMAADWGPTLTHHPAWTEGTNVEFVRVLGPTHLEVHVWERGCGLTRACGTGATAAAAMGVRRGLVPAETPIRVTLPGGDLEITVASDVSTAWMKGPAAEVSRGVIAAEMWPQARPADGG
jgi:diaminopimelate epimerase